MALGFATVNLNAAQRITANHRGSLSVYQSQGVYVEGSGYAYQGGNLNLYTPLITGEAGSVNRVKAGGAIVASRPAGAATAAQAAMAAGGAEWVLDGDSVRIDTAVALPSGKLTLAAQRGLVLGDARAWTWPDARPISMTSASTAGAASCAWKAGRATFCRRRAASSTCPPATTAPAA